MKRNFVLTILLLLALLCSCTKRPDGGSAVAEAADTVSNPNASAATDESSEMPDAQPEEIPVDAVVAVVNGTEIFYSEFAEQMANIEAMYSAMSATLSTDEINKKLTEQASGVLETLITQVLLEQQAQQQGITLTDAQQKEVDSAWEMVKQRFAETVSANYPTFSGDDLDAMVLLALESSGLSEEMVRESARTSALISGLRVREDEQVPEASEGEIQTLYDALLDQQQVEFADNASAFEAAMLGSTAVVYIPEEYRVLQEWDFRYENDVIALIKQLQQIDTEDSTAYEDTLAAEQKRVLEEIFTIQARLSGEENFDALFAEENPNGQLKINYISQNTTRFSEDYYNAAMSIAAEGEIADEPVAIQYGYSLLRWVDTLEPGVIPLEQVHDTLRTQLNTQARDQHWKQMQSLWRENAEVTIDETLISYS